MNIDLDKIPPQAIELEQIVLGTILLESNCINKIIDLFNPNIFYKDNHQKIAMSIIDLKNNNKSIDILTVTEMLRKNMNLDEIGGVAYITELTTRISSAIHVEDHFKIIYEKYLKREYIRKTSEINQICYDDSIDISEIDEYVEKEFVKFVAGDKLKRAIKLNQAIINTVKDIENCQKTGKQLLGITTGYNKLDNILNGWQDSDLIIIGARPSMGKTAIAIKLQLNALLIENIPILFFSLEMSYKQITRRILSFESGLNSNIFQQSNMDSNEWNQLENGIKKVENCELYIDDSSSLNINTLKSKARFITSEKGIKIIVIDYLQLIRTDKNSRYEEVGLISRELKGLAKELNIPIIALAQLSRKLEDRTNKEPLLSDLKESGDIEQDADVVIFIHRPEYYGKMEENGESTVGLIKMLIKKHRNGRIGNINLYRNDDWTKITDEKDFEQIKWIQENENTEQTELDFDPF